MGEEHAGIAAEAFTDDGTYKAGIVLVRRRGARCHPSAEPSPATETGRGGVGGCRCWTSRRASPRSRPCSCSSGAPAFHSVPLNGIYFTPAQPADRTALLKARFPPLCLRTVGPVPAGRPAPPCVWASATSPPPLHPTLSLSLSLPPTPPFSFAQTNNLPSVSHTPADLPAQPLSGALLEAAAGVHQSLNWFVSLRGNDHNINRQQTCSANMKRVNQK